MSISTLINTNELDFLIEKLRPLSVTKTLIGVEVLTRVSVNAMHFMFLGKCIRVLYV